MKSRLCLIASAPLFLAFPAVAQESPFLEGSVLVNEVEFEYRWMGPEELQEDQTYPLILFLHGAGERGADNEAQLRHFPERMASEPYRSGFPCFVIAPQCPKGSEWAAGGRGLALGGVSTEKPLPAMQAAMLALGQVLASGAPVDRDRIYLTGLSMGGAGTWDLAARHPNWFAAAVPICGGGDVGMAGRLAGLPLSVWHGAEDGLVEPERSREMVAAVQDVGGEVVYTELPGVRHDSWRTAYDPGNAIDWMFAQRRDPEAALSVALEQFAGSVGKKERVAFLGDSITEAGNAPLGYVDRLRVALAGKQPGATVIPAGISGHKVPNLLARCRADVIEKGATLVFIYIGINDVWHSASGRGTAPEIFEAGLRTLIQEFKQSGARVVLATPSVIGEKRSGENGLDSMLEEFAAISRTVASEEHVVLCDLQRAFHEHLLIFNGDNTDKGVLTSDGVHLNRAGNVLVALEAARSLQLAATAKK